MRIKFPHLFFIFSLFIISQAYAASLNTHTDWCSSSVFDIGTITRCDSQVAGTGLCDYAFTNSIDNTWTTLANIPPSLTTIREFPNPVSFSQIEFYTGDDCDSSAFQGQLDNFTFSVRKDGVWTTIIYQDNFNSTISRNDCTSDGRCCTQYNLTATGIDAVMFNVSDTTPDGAKNLIKGKLYACGEDYDRCPYPQLFCDDFNYAGTLSETGGWNVLNQDNSLNLTATPQTIGNTSSFLWNFTQPKSIGYSSVDSFAVNYQTAAGVRTTQSLYSPVMTTEFKLKIYSGYTSDFEFKTYDSAYNDCVNLQFEDAGDGTININYLNTTSGSEYASNIDGNISHQLKIIYYFGDKDKSYDFNTSYDYNTFELYVDGALASTKLFYDDCKTIYSAYFVKYDNHNVTIDDYYHYIGTYKWVSNIEDYFSDLYDNSTTTTDTSEIGSNPDSEEFSDVIDNFWYSFNIRTARSRFMLGLMIMFLAAVFTLGMMLKIGHVNVGAIGIIEFVTMILLVFMKLMPVWIVIIIAVISAGIGLLLVKNTAT